MKQISNLFVIHLSDPHQYGLFNVITSSVEEALASQVNRREGHSDCYVTFSETRNRFKGDPRKQLKTKKLCHVN